MAKVIAVRRRNRRLKRFQVGRHLSPPSRSLAASEHFRPPDGRRSEHTGFPWGTVGQAQNLAAIDAREPAGASDQVAWPHTSRGPTAPPAGWSPIYPKVALAGPSRIGEIPDCRGRSDRFSWRRPRGVGPLGGIGQLFDPIDWAVDKTSRLYLAGWSRGRGASAGCRPTTGFPDTWR